MCECCETEKQKSPCVELNCLKFNKLDLVISKGVSLLLSIMGRRVEKI